LPQPINAVFYRRREISTDTVHFLPTLFSIDAVKFLPIPFVFYRRRSLLTPFSIDAVKFLPTPFVFYRCRCYRHRLLSTPLAIDTACYRHCLLSTPLVFDTAWFRHRLLSTPLATAVFTAAVFDRNRYDRNSPGSRTLHFVMIRTE
jgi:hypothetical protein